MLLSLSSKSYRICLPVIFLLLTSPTLRTQDITKGLVGYYSFCDCTAKDNSENHCDGTVVGSPTCIRGSLDYGLLFNQQPGD